MHRRVPILETGWTKKFCEVEPVSDETLAPKYDHKAVEEGRYQEWLDEDVFKPSGDKKAKPYSIVIPPPNVTGK